MNCPSETGVAPVYPDQLSTYMSGGSLYFLSALAVRLSICFWRSRLALTSSLVQPWAAKASLSFWSSATSGSISRNAGLAFFSASVTAMNGGWDRIQSTLPVFLSRQIRSYGSDRVMTFVPTTIGVAQE